MTNKYEELLIIANDLEQLAKRGQKPEILGRANLLWQAAEEVSKAWSGSWLGYQANVYYANLQPPPPGAHFSREWGFRSVFAPGTIGDWAEHDQEDVQKIIYQLADDPDMSPAMEFIDSARMEFSRQKSNLFSIIEVISPSAQSQFLMDQKEAATNLSLISEHQYVQSWMPTQSNSRDSLAINQGFWVPPHVKILAQVASLRTTIDVIASLAEITKQVASHTLRQQQQTILSSPQGTRVFIGHGRSQIWRELKDFIEDRLDLLVDEYNRISVAGIPTTGRLSAMLHSAAIAFLVMTGEDEQSDGQIRARENVVHEAGLFQGQLGFERAIILLEDGCEEFSNIEGLGQIRFPKGNVSAAFEEIRLFLEREGVLSAGANP